MDRHKLRRARRGVCLAVLVLGAGCRRESAPEAGPVYSDKDVANEAVIEYSFAVNPLHNPVRLFQIYQPMVDLINARTEGFRLKLETSENFAAFEAKLARRSVHFALANPYQTLQAEKTGYRILAAEGDTEKVRGVILVRKDSGVKEIADLKGATISFPAPTALVATMMPKYYLKKAGLDVEKEAKPVYVGTQDSAIMNVYQGLSKAGCSWLGLWEQLTRERPEIAEAVEVKWMTEPIINKGFVARDDVPESHMQMVREAIVTLHTTAAGRAALEKTNLTRYEPATSETYEPVRVFMKEYEAEFGTQTVRKGQP